MSAQTTLSEVRSRLIPANELAEMLQVSTRTLWRLLSTGRLIRPVKIGAATRWRLSEVEDWISKGCPVPVSDQQ